MFRVSVVIFFVLIISCSAVSQNVISTDIKETENNAYYNLLEKGELFFSADFSLGTNKRKAAEKPDKNFLKLTDYYSPYLSVGIGITEQITIGVDVAFRISKAELQAEINLPKTTRTINREKTISGLDIITLWGSLGLIKEHKYIPSVVLNSYFYIPYTGKAEYRIENPGFYPELIFHNSFGEKFDISYSAGVCWDGIYEYPVYSLVFRPGYYPSDEIYIYAELWNSFTKKISPDNYLTLDFSYFVNDNFLIDIYGGTTLQDPRHNIFGGVTFNYSLTAF